MDIEQSVLRGHRAEVTCLDSSVGGSCASLVASGSEDRTVRLWDSASSPVRSIKCWYQCFTSSIEQVKFSKRDDHIVYVASVDRLYCFDSRKDSVLDSMPLSTSIHQFNDISTMELSPTNNCIVLSDDSDVVCKIDIDGAGCFKDDSLRKLRSLHTNSIGSLAFSDKKSELYSGGFDFSIVKWDLDNARPIKRLELTSFETVDSSNQMFNPPFVTHLEAIEDSPVLIAALGDGSVRFLSAGELSTLFAFQAHSAMIVSSSYLGEGRLVTAGLDSKVCCWQVTNLPSKKKKKGKSKESDIEVTQQWAIDHRGKINAATALHSSSNQVYVCDTTNDISAYSVRG